MSEPGQSAESVGTGSELVCPAGTPAALHAAVDAGAHAIYVGLQDDTNARNFPGLNFSPRELQDARAYTRFRGAKLFLAINTFARAGGLAPWHNALALANDLGVDAAIVADLGVAAHAAKHYPDLRLHLSVQAGASNPAAIAFYQRHFNVRRVVLPRVLTLAEVERLTQAVTVETEVFVYGGLCVMAEGRCALSSYCTGQSPNMQGVCSPASHVSYRDEPAAMVSRLGDFTINRFAPDEPAGYPTLCKGRFRVGTVTDYVFEDPVSLNADALLPALVAAGVQGFKIEGRQRSRAYVSQVVGAFRAALDALSAGQPMPVQALAALSEGGTQTQGAYQRRWQ